jgi:hypothetical protein
MNLFIILSFLVFCFCLGLYGDEVSAPQENQPAQQIEPNQPENKKIEEEGTLDPWYENEKGAEKDEYEDF